MDLIHGECLVELKKLEDKSIDFFYLDLPYGQTACKWDNKIDLTSLWIQLKRLAKNERTAFFFSCTTKFGYELIKANEKYFRWDLVWEKNRASGFLNAYKLPMRKHEMVYCFAKKCPEYDVSSHSEFTIESKNRKKAMKLETHNNQTINKTAKVHKERLPTSVCEIYKTPRLKDRTNHKEKLPTSVLPSSWVKCPVDSKTNHRTSKPVPLMEFLLKYWTKEGDIICDPTMGAGSMGVACKNMNRKFIGIELDEDIYNIAFERIIE